ncbi:MAG: biotin--[acetyl-CoA-carboxylase] ligase [Treponema sp.]|nr:biotin--[acetyl-CoA-carboxylase] ligase [Treponema sp.]
MKNNPDGLSGKAKLLKYLREKQGEPLSGTALAKKMEVSRVAVWKTVQSLCEAGYSIETGESGYSLNPKNEKDFLYPWEFFEKENNFYHYKNTTSTMDRARETAFRGAESGTVFTAEKQSAGRGRNGRTWVSRQGGLFFSILERPGYSIADYSLLSLVMQIAVTRSLSKVCAKKAYLRWPNDIYINSRKIAGITTELSGEGDIISWLTAGIGVNVNNPAPSGKAASCMEITGHNISRRDVLINILNEIGSVKKTFSSKAVYSQGNPALAKEWNSYCDCINAKALVFEPVNSAHNVTAVTVNEEKHGKILARGVFQGIDPAGRCILKTDDSTLYFNHGTVSVAFLNP